jgi:hypothetical protein
LKRLPETKKGEPISKERADVSLFHPRVPLKHLPIPLNCLHVSLKRVDVPLKWVGVSLFCLHVSKKHPLTGADLGYILSEVAPLWSFFYFHINLSMLVSNNEHFEPLRRIALVTQETFIEEERS